MATDSLQDQLQRALGASYTIEREIGAGGMSTVFAAVEMSLGRRVALKVLQPELLAELSADRFAREVRLAASLQQANIVPLLSAGTANGFPYYTMPLVDGNSLRARLAAGDPVPLADAVSILKDVARALAYAHHAGVVHRDIKPDNILLSGGTAVVSDFGIAKAMDAARTGTSATITQAGVSIGTPGYMAPEQVAGEDVDHRADIYAWGVVAWELLATRHPFASRTTRQAMLAAHLTEEPDSIESHAKVPPALAALVMSTLHKDPARRPQSSSEILAVLDAAATPLPSHAPARGFSRWIAAAVGVVALIAAGVVFGLPRLRGGSTPPAGSDSGLPSVAVLPLDNIGGDTTQEYFTDGLTDELATALGRVPGLRVTARSAAYRYKGRRDLDLREVGAELRARYLLLGSVRRTGQQLVLSAQLVESSGAVEIWSDVYRRPADSVMSLQDSLTAAITNALAARLGPAQVTATGAPTTNRGTESLDAYDLYLKGHYYLNRRRPGLEGAVTSFEAAIAKDDRFARAYAGLANALALLTYFGTRPLEQQRVIAAAQRALDLDSTLADAHVGLGIMQMSVGQFAVAERSLKEAIEIEPRNAAAHFQLGRCLMYIGRLDEAMEAYEKAKELEPYQATTATWMGYTLLHRSTPDRALAEANRAWELDSSSAVVQIVAVMTAQDARRSADARRYIGSSPSRTVMNQGSFAYVLGAAGHPDSARATIAEIEGRNAARWNDYINLAFASLGVGDTARAMDALDKAFERDQPVASFWPLWAPMFDSIRETARFKALARRVGVNPAPPVRRGQ